MKFASAMKLELAQLIEICYTETGNSVEKQKKQKGELQYEE